MAGGVLAVRPRRARGAPRAVRGARDGAAGASRTRAARRARRARRTCAPTDGGAPRRHDRVRANLEFKLVELSNARAVAGAAVDAEFIGPPGARRPRAALRAARRRRSQGRAANGGRGRADAEHTRDQVLERVPARIKAPGVRTGATHLGKSAQTTCGARCRRHRELFSPRLRRLAEPRGGRETRGAPPRARLTDSSAESRARRPKAAPAEGEAVSRRPGVAQQGPVCRCARCTSAAGVRGRTAGPRRATAARRRRRRRRDAQHGRLGPRRGRRASSRRARGGGGKRSSLAAGGGTKSPGGKRAEPHEERRPCSGPSTPSWGRLPVGSKARRCPMGRAAVCVCHVCVDARVAGLTARRAARSVEERPPKRAGRAERPRPPRRRGEDRHGARPSTSDARRAASRRGRQVRGGVGGAGRRAPIDDGRRRPRRRAATTDVDGSATRGPAMELGLAQRPRSVGKLDLGERHAPSPSPDRRTRHGARGGSGRRRPSRPAPLAPRGARGPRRGARARRRRAAVALDDGGRRARGTRRRASRRRGAGPARGAARGRGASCPCRLPRPPPRPDVASTPTASTELLSDAATASRSSSSLAASWRPRASMPTTRPSGDRACLSGA